jgi:hypothetical protein
MSSKRDKDVEAGKTILSSLTLTKMIHSFQNARKRHKRAKARAKNEQGLFHWHRRIIKEMQQNKRIQQKLMDGHFDRYL